MNKIIEKELIKNAKAFLNTGNSFKTSAFQYFETHGLPENITNIVSPRFVTQPESNTDILPSGIMHPDAVIHFINGIYNAESSQLPDSIVISSEAVTNDFIDSYDALNALASLSPANFTITKNTHLDFPITILHTLTEAGVNKIISPRISIKVEENCQVAILEIFSPSERQSIFQYTTNAYTAFEIKANAEVEHVVFSNEAKNSAHFGWTKANLAKDARFYSTVINCGHMHANHQLQINLEAAGAETTANALFTIEKNEKSNLTTKINHNFSHTHSTQLCKGILKDESYGFFDGKIFVAPDSQEITSAQLNKNLLLSKKAHIKTQPNLLVSADDVKCSHGATVGQLSDEETFYLESRGINKEKAREILMKGFAAEIILLIKNHRMRTYCETKITKI